MTDETAWLGGQFTSQGVSPDEHRFIEYFGSSETYRDLRRRVRDYYRRNFPLTARARATWNLNIGSGECSSLSVEPRGPLAAINELLAPFIHSGRLLVLQPFRAVQATRDGDAITSVTVSHVHTDESLVLEGAIFVDATELGDILDLAGVEHVIGAESKDQTGEPHALDIPNPRMQEAITWCAAVDYLEGTDNTIERPKRYDHFRTHVPPGWHNPQLNYAVIDYDHHQPFEHSFLPVEEDAPMWRSLWTHRRMLDVRHFEGSLYRSDITLMNWSQNDYVGGPIVGVSPEEARHHWEMSRQLTLSMVYWLQTEAPRLDGGTGFPGLRLRGDVMGTTDGLAMYPYIREARRLQAEVTVLEHHISAEVHKTAPPRFEDSVGVGNYYIDMHQRTEGGLPFYVYVWPFQIPLGALIPVRVRNLVAAAKNIGTTHLTNSAYRMHATEWGIGEAAGHTAAYCAINRTLPTAVRGHERTLSDLQHELVRSGVDITWPDLTPDVTWEDHLSYTVHPTAAISGLGRKASIDAARPGS